MASFEESLFVAASHQQAAPLQLSPVAGDLNPGVVGYSRGPWIFSSQTQCISDGLVRLWMFLVMGLSCYCSAQPNVFLQ